MYPQGRLQLPGPDFCRRDGPNSYWPDQGLPKLKLFVSKESFLVLNILDHATNELRWLSRPVVEWKDDEAYNTLETFVRNAVPVNDPAER
jgi:hypothetical protein